MVPFVCVTGHGVDSDSCQPWVSAVCNVLTTTALLSNSRLMLTASFMDSTRAKEEDIGLPLFLLPPIFLEGITFWLLSAT